MRIALMILIVIAGCGGDGSAPADMTDASPAPFSDMYDRPVPDLKTDDMYPPPQCREAQMGCIPEQLTCCDLHCTKTSPGVYQCCNIQGVVCTQDSDCCPVTGATAFCTPDTRICSSH